MLNKVQIIGRLGRDPELRQMQSGSVCNLTVATDESYSDRNTGQRIEKTEWHRVVVFNKVADAVAKFCTKGSLVYVEGKLATRKWTDQNGQERYTTEIRADRVQFLDGKGDQRPQSGYEYHQARGSMKEVDEPPF